MQKIDYFFNTYPSTEFSLTESYGVGKSSHVKRLCTYMTQGRDIMIAFIDDKVYRLESPQYKSLISVYFYDGNIRERYCFCTSDYGKENEEWIETNNIKYKRKHLYQSRVRVKQKGDIYQLHIRVEDEIATVKISQGSEVLDRIEGYCYYNQIPYMFDINRDDYFLDFDFTGGYQGRFQEHSFFLWDNEHKKYVEVELDNGGISYYCNYECICEYETHDGYIRNFRNDRVMQIWKWDGFRLVKVSEEQLEVAE